MNLKAYDKVVSEARNLCLSKNQDYSRHLDNIGMTGLHGIGVRLVDKMTRCYNLTFPSKNAGKAAVKSESLRDTFIDMINYAVFGIMLMDGSWKIDRSVHRDNLEGDGVDGQAANLIEAVREQNQKRKLDRTKTNTDSVRSEDGKESRPAN